MLNASNEIAVHCFLNNKIKFTDIYKIISEMLSAINPNKPTNIDDVIEIDTITRMKTLNYIKRL